MSNHLTDEDRGALVDDLRYGSSSDLFKTAEAIVARHVEAERERIAQEIEALSCLVCGDSNGWRHATDEAARIARETGRTEEEA